MKHIVDTVNKINLTIKPLDLAGRVPFTDSIELLRVELQYQDGVWTAVHGTGSVRPQRC